MLVLFALSDDGLCLPSLIKYLSVPCTYEAMCLVAITTLEWL